MRSNTIRWGIIGCGDVTEVKSGPALQNAKGSELIAVMRRSGELAEDYAKRHDVPKWTDKADKLIQDPDVNAVYVATPPSSHKLYAIKAAKVNKPVYVEKPMSLNYPNCLDMIESCEENGVPLYIAYYRRALPRFLKIKNIIDEKWIGAVRFVDITFHQKPREDDLRGKLHWRVDPAISGGGYFCDLASHMLDFLQFCLGDIERAYGFSSHQMKLYKAEDMVNGVFEFPGGVLGTGVWNFTAYNNVDRTEIVGEKGKITFSTFDETPVRVESKYGVEEYNIKNPQHIQEPLIQQVVDSLLGKGDCPSTGHTAARTNWVMDQLLEKTE